MKANILSLSIKILGAVIILTSLILNGFQVWNISMGEVIIGVGALEMLVLPIDISKIKSSNK